MTVTGYPRIVAGVEVNEVADGYIVHQPALGRVHYLNHTAAIVLELCNGRNAEADLAGLLQSAYGLAAPPVEDVAACLTSLRQQRLII